MKEVVYEWGAHTANSFFLKLLTLKDYYTIPYSWVILEEMCPEF